MRDNPLAINPDNHYNPVNRIEFPDYSFLSTDVTDEQIYGLNNVIIEKLKPFNEKYNEVMKELKKVDEKLQNAADNGLSRAEIEELKKQQRKLQKQEQSVVNEMSAMMEKEFQTFHKELNQNRKETSARKEPQKKEVKLSGVLSDDYNSRMEAKKEYPKTVNKGDYVRHQRKKKEEENPSINDLKAEQRKKRVDSRAL